MTDEPATPDTPAPADSAAMNIALVEADPTQEIDVVFTFADAGTRARGRVMLSVYLKARGVELTPSEATRLASVLDELRRVDD